MIEFIKMHGLGNDFVIIDSRQQQVALTRAQIARLCDRNFGIGCDLLTVLEDSNGADIRAVFYNADGSESGACGNATRCVADLVLNETGKQRCAIETAGGMLQAWRAEDGMYSVDMGVPRLGWQDIPLAQEVDTLQLPLDGGPSAANMGNPHCVFFAADKSVDKFDDAYAAQHGKLIEHDALFPQRTNVEFVTPQGDNHFRQKTWERGVGLTMACGTGACAVAVSAIRRGLADRTRPVKISLDGGALYISWPADDAPVIMTGCATHVFSGTYQLEDAHV